jgi:hypothetical protein
MFEDLNFHILNLVLKMLPAHPKLVAIVGLVFDAEASFFNGCKTGYSYTAGHPAVRGHFIKQFNSAHGFRLVAAAMLQPDCPWLGGDILLSILKAMMDREVRE